MGEDNQKDKLSVEKWSQQGTTSSSKRCNGKSVAGACHISFMSLDSMVRYNPPPGFY